MDVNVLRRSGVQLATRYYPETSAPYGLPLPVILGDEVATRPDPGPGSRP